MRQRTLSLLVAVIAGVGSAHAADILPHRDDLSIADRVRVVAVTSAPVDFSKAQPFEAMSGGAATSVAPPSRDAFSQPFANLSFRGEQDFRVGNGLFRKLWVSSPSSTRSSDGLGPLFNARSCQRCHLKDGRGHPPEGPDDPATSLFLRLSVPPGNAEQRKQIKDGTRLVIGEPTYGSQLQDFAVPGLPAEGQLTINYQETVVMLNGGEVVQLRAPRYGIRNPGYGPLAPDTMISPRIAPQMIGLGLIDAIHPGDIFSNADPDDRDGDGISGRVSMVRDPVTGEMMPGRYGHKASTATVLAQSAGAFAGDIGISSRLAPDPYGECTERQLDCLEKPHGVQPAISDYEATDTILDLVVFYSKNLAVPVRRDTGSPQVLRGKQVFHNAGCAVCHRPSYVTSRKAEQPEHRFQLIWPFTDLLLHDMGEGLADNRPVGNANGREWRTAPLWGIGLTETVSGHTYFLHDGRARNLLEAILWHGGEARASRDRVVDMPAEQRRDLIRFLESL